MRIKGVVLQARQDFVQENFGEEAWQQVLQALSPEGRTALRGPIFAGCWYPFEIGEQLDRTIVDVLGAGDERIFEDIGVRSARRTLAKEHSAFLSPGDPQAFMHRAGLIYRFYYDTGRREYQETGPTSGVLTTYEAETFSAPDCLTVIGWYKEALRMCGATEVEIVEEECRARGGSCCRYRVWWKI